MYIYVYIFSTITIPIERNTTNRALFATLFVEGRGSSLPCSDTVNTSRLYYRCKSSGTIPLDRLHVSCTTNKRVNSRLIIEEGKRVYESILVIYRDRYNRDRGIRDYWMEKLEGKFVIFIILFGTLFV